MTREYVVDILEQLGFYKGESIQESETWTRDSLVFAIRVSKFYPIHSGQFQALYIDNTFWNVTLNNSSSEMFITETFFDKIDYELIYFKIFDIFRDEIRSKKIDTILGY